MPFEFPLNEKFRAYLRLDHLLSRLFAEANEARWPFFRALFDVQDVLERGDIKAELIKDLERTLEQLGRWASMPGVDSARLASLSDALSEQRQWLLAQSRLGSAWRSEPLLMAMRSRFSVAGGDAAFDVPQLGCWLAREATVRQADVGAWLSAVEPLAQALALFLKLVREGGRKDKVQARNGFYQGSAEHLVLLLVGDLSPDLYPSVSGHRGRYTIRLMRLGDDGESLPVAEDLPLTLCHCSWS